MSEQLAGDEQQLLELSQDLRRLAGHLVKDPGAADDVVQEAWLAALDRPANEVRSLRDWMRAVVRRLAQKRARSERRRADVEALTAARDEVSFDAEIDARLSTQRLLRAAVDEVREPARAVLVAHYFEGHTLEAVAATLGRPLETVRTQRRRGLAELRAALDRRHAGDRSAWASLLLILVRRGDASLRAAPRRMGLAAAGALVAGLAVYLAITRDVAEPGVGSAQPTAASQPPEPAGGDLLAATGAQLPRESIATDSTTSPATQIGTGAAVPALRRLDVRVVDRDGVPVAGAKVLITASLEEPDLPIQVADDRGRTTIEIEPSRLMGGPFFEPPAGGLALRAYAAGHAYSKTYCVPVVEEQGSYEIVLGGPEHIVDVHVVDPDGDPVVGVLVEANKRRFATSIGEDGVLRTETSVTTITRDEGRGKLAGLERREHEIDVTVAGFLPQTLHVTSLEPRSQLEIRLERGTVLTGEVRGADGTPIVGAIVSEPNPDSMHREPRSTSTDHHGRFRFPGLQPGNARIFVRGPEPMSARADVIVEIADRGETWTSITLRERPPLTIRVVDAGSGTVEGIVVSLASRSGSEPAWRDIGFVGPTGVCSFATFPSELLDCVVSRGSDGYVYDQFALDARQADETVVRVDVGSVAAISTLRGIVLDARGAPLTGVVVRDVHDGVLDPGGWMVDPVTGAFESRNVKPGAMRWLAVSREGVAELGQAVVEPGSRIDLGTVLTPQPGRVRITCTTAPAPDDGYELFHRTHAATGVVEGRVHEFPVDTRELVLLPYDYTLRVLDASGRPKSESSFRVTSDAEVEVVLP